MEKERTKTKPKRIVKQKHPTNPDKSESALKAQSPKPTKPSVKATPKPKIVSTRKKVKKKKRIKKPVGKVLKKQEVEEALPEELQWLEDDPHDNILSRFVIDEKGFRIGESIGVEGKQLIVKKRKSFYSIPLKSVRERDKELQLIRKINWTNAEKKGEKWRKKALDPIKSSK